eukprot:1067545-Pyramimonas_sp.AAC.1
MAEHVVHAVAVVARQLRARSATDTAPAMGLPHQHGLWRCCEKALSRTELGTLPSCTSTAPVLSLIHI